MKPFALALSLFVLVSTSHAQPALDQLEGQLGPKANAPAPLADDEIGYLGIVVDDRADAPRGVRIQDVAAGSPAARSGLRIGDLITGLDASPVTSMAEFAAVMTAARPEQRVAFQVARGDRAYEIVVTLGTRPAQADRKFPLVGQPDGPSLPGLGGPPLAEDTTARKRLLGVRTIPLTEQAQQFFQLPVSRGAVVTAIAPGSPADLAVLPLDAVIVAVDDQPVGNPDELASRIDAAGEGAQVELSFYSRGALQRRRVTLRDFASQSTTQRDNVRELEIPVTDDPVDDDRAELVDRLRRLEQRLHRLETMLQRMMPPPGAFPPGMRPGDT